jgi:hypothetical protein
MLKAAAGRASRPELPPFGKRTIGAKSPPSGLFMRTASVLLPAGLPVSGASMANGTGSRCPCCSTAPIRPPRLCSCIHARSESDEALSRGACSSSEASVSETRPRRLPFARSKSSRVIPLGKPPPDPALDAQRSDRRSRPGLPAASPVQHEPGAHDQQSGARAGQRRQGLLQGHASHVGDHEPVPVLPPPERSICSVMALEIAASSSADTSYSSWRLHH